MDLRRSFAQHQKSNLQASRQRKARPSRLQVGLSVLLKCQSTGSNFQLMLTIVNICGTKVTAKRGGEEVFQNMSHFKKFPGPLPFTPELVGDDLGGVPEDTSHQVTPPRWPGQEGGPDLTGSPPAEGVTAPLVTRGRSGKARYNLRANPASSLLMQIHVTYDCLWMGD
ncbi:hypothetical protein NDU88_003972 [Pleurodeles waltl]|uniref:Uncharacterized protein n=1 Tax=Pleurodeles waltl TaxID=8319 RepID=A0AAV7QD70_PLEWA|nr:hypothetical protein NDU88_003972 [Pleurodeles waltl]